MIAKWATDQEGLGLIAFATKKAALEQYPDCVPQQCEFSMGFRGWLALDRYGTDNRNSIRTPDGRTIADCVVSGWASPFGKLIGMRGINPKTEMHAHWMVIMQRVVQDGLTLANYRQTEASHD